MHPIVLNRSTNAAKKFMVTITNDQTGRTKTVHFGSSGMSDYTIHKDKARMARYIARHAARETWTKAGLATAGFWSRWLLWSKPTLRGALRGMAAKFDIQIAVGRGALGRGG